MLETLDYTIRIGSTPTFLYFDLIQLSMCRDVIKHPTAIPSTIKSL